MRGAILMFWLLSHEGPLIEVESIGMGVELVGGGGGMNEYMLMDVEPGVDVPAPGLAEGDVGAPYNG